MNATKGETTKETILKAAFELSTLFGLESLTIGTVADKVGLSKSGLFGHFKSKEKLQVMVLEYSAFKFTQTVLVPATKEKRGIPRIKGIIEYWLKWTDTVIKGGCPLLTAAIEFDDRPGVVQDKVQELLGMKIKFIEKAASIAVDEGHFPKNTDVKQFAYELYSLMIGHHIYARLLKNKDAKKQLNKSLEQLINHYQKPAN